MRESELSLGVSQGRMHPTGGLEGVGESGESGLGLHACRE